MQGVHQKLCERCGDPARVRSLLGYQAGAPVMQSYCLACADSAPVSKVARAGAPGRSLVALRYSVVFAGLLLMVVGAMGDYLGIRGSPGFGWYQRVGLLFGALLLACGALLRVDFVVICGGMIVAIAAAADWLHLVGDGTFGWKQESAVIAGFLVALIGLVMERRARTAREAEDFACKR